MCSILLMNQKIQLTMKFIKEKKEERRDYIFQKDKKTILAASILGLILVVLVSAVTISGIDLELHHL